jgi:hypothetical protein
MFPRANQDLSVCEKFGVPKSKPRLCLFALGRRESGGTSRPNNDVVVGQCDLVAERGPSSKLTACAPKSPILSVGTTCRPLNSRALPVL